MDHTGKERWEGERENPFPPETKPDASLKKLLAERKSVRNKYGQYMNAQVNYGNKSINLNHYGVAHHTGCDNGSDGAARYG